MAREAANGVWAEADLNDGLRDDVSYTFRERASPGSTQMDWA